MKLTKTMRDAFVRAAMDDVPKIDYDEQQRKLVVDDAISQLPPKVRAIYNDEATKPYVHTTYAYRLGGFSVPSAGSYEASESVRVEYARIEGLAKSQNDARNELCGKLNGCAASVTTRKALAELLPEFEKYLPVDEPAAIRTLPVVQNVVADFVKAGWPKTARKVSRT